MPRIRLFVSDIDGCLAAPYTPYDLDTLHTLATYAHKAGSMEARADTALPVLSLCSGRPYSYVEAMAQVLGLTTPVLFESGAGMFDPVAAQTTWHPAFTPELQEQVAAMRDWFAREAVPGTKISIDYGKRAQAGIVTPDPDEIKAVRPRTIAFAEKHLPDLKVCTTDVSIDVISPAITKEVGLQWLGEHLDVSLSEMAFIGDTDGDIEAIQAVAYGFAPANAHDVVKDQADYVTEKAVAAGTLEAYRWCVASYKQSV